MRSQYNNIGIMSMYYQQTMQVFNDTPLTMYCKMHKGTDPADQGGFTVPPGSTQTLGTAAMNEAVTFLLTGSAEATGIAAGSWWSPDRPPFDPETSFVIIDIAANAQNSQSVVPVVLAPYYVDWVLVDRKIYQSDKNIPCVLKLTSAGIMCSDWFDTGCTPMLGVSEPPYCSGFRKTETKVGCATWCAANPSECAQAKQSLCFGAPQKPKLGQESFALYAPECVCSLGFQSKLKVPSTMNLTFIDYINHMATIGTSVSSYPVCWHPACNDVQSVITDDVKQSIDNCPEDIVTCVNYFHDVTVNGGDIDVSNNCNAYIIRPPAPPPAPAPAPAPSSAPSPSPSSAPTPTPSPSPSSAPSPSSSFATKNMYLYIGIGVAVVAVVIIGIMCFLAYRAHARKLAVTHV